MSKLSKLSHLKGKKLGVLETGNVKETHHLTDDGHDNLGSTPRNVTLCLTVYSCQHVDSCSDGSFARQIVLFKVRVSFVIQVPM
jgi:hypothetical protein